LARGRERHEERGKRRRRRRGEEGAKGVVAIGPKRILNFTTMFFTGKGMFA